MNMHMRDGQTRNRPGGNSSIRPARTAAAYGARATDHARARATARRRRTARGAPARGPARSAKAAAWHVATDSDTGDTHTAVHVAVAGSLYNPVRAVSGEGRGVLYSEGRQHGQQQTKKERNDEVTSTRNTRSSSCPHHRRGSVHSNRSDDVGNTYCCP
jgi:hypothetical protein